VWGQAGGDGSTVATSVQNLGKRHSHHRAAVSVGDIDGKRSRIFAHQQQLGPQLTGAIECFEISVVQAVEVGTFVIGADRRRTGEIEMKARHATVLEGLQSQPPMAPAVPFDRSSRAEVFGFTHPR
jgi:hypothetical protein